MKLRLAITIIWVGLLSLLVGRTILVPKLDTDVTSALAKAREESHYGVWFKNQRIGYVENRVQPKGEGAFTLVQRALLRLNVLNQSRQIDMNLDAELDAKQQLKAFSFSFRSPFYTMDAKGVVKGHTLHLVTDTGGDKRKETIPLPDAPFISTNHRAYLLDSIPEIGQKFKIPFFDPLTLSSRETIITYKGREKLVIKKRIHRLHHFESRFSGVRINFWLDDGGKVIKEESPAGFVFLAEPQFKAVEIEDGGQELLQAVAVSYSGRLPVDDNPEKIDYRLELPAEVPLDLNGGRQRFENGNLQIWREKLPEIETEPSGHGCEKPQDILASRYVQADHADIIDQGRQIVSENNDPLQTVQALAAWVYDHIDKRPVMGLPDALATLKNRKGDCNEHAALFAALARSQGIPTRIAAGVTLHQKQFYYHAWNEVCVKGQWLSLDTTKNQLPADLTHIRLVYGDLEDQMRIGAVVGKLKIAILDQKE